MTFGPKFYNVRFGNVGSTILTILFKHKIADLFHFSLFQLLVKQRLNVLLHLFWRHVECVDQVVGQRLLVPRRGLRQLVLVVGGDLNTLVQIVESCHGADAAKPGMDGITVHGTGLEAVAALVTQSPTVGRPYSLRNVENFSRVVSGGGSIQSFLFFCHWKY